MIKQCWL